MQKRKQEMGTEIAEGEATGGGGGVVNGNQWKDGAASC